MIQALYKKYTQQQVLTKYIQTHTQYIYRHTHTHIQTHTQSIKTIFLNIYIYIYIQTHTIRSLLFSRFSNIQPQYIYFSKTFYSLAELFCLLWYFCSHGCFVFSICKCCSLRHIKFSFILLFTISCDRATQSIPGYS